MSRVKIEDIIDYLDSDIRKALKIAVDKVVPGNNINERDLFKEFKKGVYRKCNTWEYVPDHLVEKD